jgi:hypothetical protein
MQSQDDYHVPVSLTLESVEFDFWYKGGCITKTTRNIVLFAIVSVEIWKFTDRSLNIMAPRYKALFSKQTAYCKKHCIITEVLYMQYLRPGIGGTSP